MTDPAKTTPIAIIGATGALGYGLALRFGMAGLPVMIGSRDPERASRIAEQAGLVTGQTGFSGWSNEEATARSDVVILCVPFLAHASTLKQLKPFLSAGHLVIDATVPLASAVGGRATRMLGIRQGSAAQQARELLPAAVGLVATLHTVSAAKLGQLEHPLAEDVLLCGDDRANKQRAAELFERIHGLRAVDAGALEMSGIVESLTALMISMNIRYKAHAGLQITGLPASLWAMRP